MLFGSRPKGFALQDLSGNTRRLSDLLGRIGILVFWSCECPHVERLDRSLLDHLAGWPQEVTVWRIASAANEPVEEIRDGPRDTKPPRDSAPVNPRTDAPGKKSQTTFRKSR